MGYSVVAPQVLSWSLNMKEDGRGPRESAGPEWHRELEASCVNAVSLMTETSRRATVSYRESAWWHACCLLGVASHTGPLPSNSE